LLKKFKDFLRFCLQNFIVNNYSKSIEASGVASVIDDGAGANGVVREVVDHLGRNGNNRK